MSAGRGPADPSPKNIWCDAKDHARPCKYLEQNIFSKRGVQVESRNSRLSLAVAPGSEALPGNSEAIFSQAASPTTNRDLSSIAPTPPKQGLTHDRSAGGILNVNTP